MNQIKLFLLNNKYILIVCVILISVLCYVLFLPKEKESIVYEPVFTESQVIDAIEYIYVDIKGYVNKPGVYAFSKKDDNRVNDQTTPNMIQKLNLLFTRKPLISKEI